MVGTVALHYLKERVGELLDGILVEVHAVLVHARAHYVLQLRLLDKAVACTDRGMS